MKKISFKTILALQLVVMVYTLSGVMAKLASGYESLFTIIVPAKTTNTPMIFFMDSFGNICFLQLVHCCTRIFLRLFDERHLGGGIVQSPGRYTGVRC